MKVCRTCGFEGTEDQFTKGRNRCKSCSNKYNSNFYHKERPTIIDGESIMKTCDACLIQKPLEQFAKLRNICRKCHNKKETERESKKPIEPGVKICFTCATEKAIEEFPKRKGQCKACRKIYLKIYREEHSEELRTKAKIKYDDNREEILAESKIYNISHKKERNKYIQMKRKEDPCFKIRGIITNHIGLMIKKNGGSKANKSSQKYLPWQWKEFAAYMENLFIAPENLGPDNNPWMGWHNHGPYIVDGKNAWDDNNIKTWKWQIDHIIPHSLFKYNSMDCQGFRDCWALSNLRPLSAKQNILDGAQRTRHKKNE